MTSSDDAATITTRSMAAASSATEMPAAAVELSSGAARRLHPSRGRRALLAILFLLSCLAILTSSVTLWVHQVALNTDRYVGLVGPVAADPAVQAAMSEVLANQIIVTLNVEQRIRDTLPGPAGLAAGPITGALEDRIQQRLAKVMATPGFQQAWITANRVAHQTIVKILRGDAASVDVQNGYVYLDLWSLVGVGLAQLQEIGFIPAGVTLPDVSNGLSPGAEAAIEKVLGVTLPADFGMVKLVPADKLVRAQQLVHYFDLITIGLVLLAILLSLVTIWYAPRRLRMVIYLAIGGAAAIILARFAIQSVTGSILDSLADGDTATTVRAVIGAVFDNLWAFTRLIVISSILVAILVYLSSRPRWLVSLRDRAGARGAAPAGAGVGTGSAAGGSAPGPAGATADPAAEASAASSSGASMTGWAREHLSGLRLAGIAAIAFIIGWAAFGLELALLAVLLVVLLEVALHAIGATAPEGGGGAEAGTAGSDAEPGSTGATGAVGGAGTTGATTT